MSNSISLYALDAENGDCLLLVNHNTNYTVLIDSGPKSSRVSKNLAKTIKELISDREVDLAIVTHNDDDHIGGFKHFISEGIEIKKFIFNHHDYIDRVLRQSRNVKVSLNQDVELNGMINNKIIPLELSEDGYFLGKKFDEFNIDFRSPNREKLEKYSTWIQKEKKKQRNIKVARNKAILSIDEQREQAKDDSSFVEDRREPNGSSLALDIAFYGYRILLLGDAHPTTVIQSYEKSNPSKIKYDLVKLSHHGSDKNTNNELLSIFECDHFLICSNSDNNHNHPSPTTIFRVLGNNNSKIYITKNSGKVNMLENSMGITFIKPDAYYLEFKYEF
ncbi:ComEC/Rec2 family competence protein [Vibrio cholerae]|uniref:ComEC/Rec2 family competence protein n=1 Tax=Vibrio cholerae TaxID=666 RepID=UPI00115AF89C|nr:MBL fold metallo-hydrolase [Vibrio cholerae]TQP38075.1 MBL fold metallo-hydrolase [Vibrio cholerae]TQP61601.1 MBL fold metallo-hydrolase [Vibrio cholerae]